MSKKYIISFILTFLLCSMSNQVFAAPSFPTKDANIAISIETVEDDDCEFTDVIKRVSFRDKLRRSPETQIKSFFKKYNRYSSKNNVEKLKQLYTNDYVNNDGFDKEILFKMMDLASGAYKEVKYTTEILSMEFDGNYAVVKAREIAKGETEDVLAKVNDTGEITSDIFFTNYMRKEGNSWKIYASEVNKEEVHLKYGEAKNMTVNISAPQIIPAGSEYEVSARLETPHGTFAVGSIINDKITFPQEQSKDVFKPIRNSELARIIKSNKDGFNEYATLSVAISRAQVDKSEVVLNITGVAFSMKRVNLLSVNKELDISKESLNAKSTKKTTTSKK